jgi:hypothetical protein
MTQKLSFAEILTDLTRARECFEEVKSRKDAIEREMANATNHLNGAQKAFDQAVVAIRKDAPWNTDWHSELHRIQQRVA